MQYLQQINKSRSIYEGYRLMYRNWHLSDILICNLYDRINKWNDFVAFYQGTAPYQEKFDNIEEFVAKYDNLVRTVRKFQQHWISPIMLLYPTPMLHFQITDENVEIMKGWLDLYYPATNYINKQVITLHVLQSSEEPGHPTHLLNEGVFLITFRNDRGTWTKTNDYYRPRGC